MRYSIYAAFSVLSLSACGGSGGPVMTSGPIFTQADVQAPQYASTSGSLGGGFSGTINIVGAGGYRYGAGYGTDSGPNASAELLAGTPVFNAPTIGSASMSGPWEIARATNLAEAGGNWSGDIVSDRGVITLNADFGARTLTGINGDLTVSGTFVDSQLGGTVSYGGLEGNLAGAIGGSSAIGIFTSGSSSSEVYAGGFAVSRN